MGDPLTILLSATGGAVIAGVAGWLNQRWRWRRDYDIRWDADRRRIYAAFLANCSLYSDAIRDLVAALNVDNADEVSGRLQALEDAHRELMLPAFELDLLARERLVVAADNLKADRFAFRHAVKQGELNPKEWEDRWVPLRNAVINAARDELKEPTLRDYR